MRRKLISLVLVLSVLLLTMAGCSATAETVAFGETATLKEWDITAQKYDYEEYILSAPDSDSGYKADEGNVLLVVQLKVTNNGDQTSKFLKTLYDKSKDVDLTIQYNNKEYVCLFVSEYSEGLNTIDIEAGESITGNALFELPESVETAEPGTVKMTASIGNHQIIFTL